MVRPSSSPFLSQHQLRDPDEATVGLLASYGRSEDLYPPSSPPTSFSSSSPFRPPKSARCCRPASFPFVALCLALFCLVFLVSSIRHDLASLSSYSDLYAVLRSQPLRNRLHAPPPRELARDGIRVDEATEGEYTVTAIVLHGLGQPNHEPPFVERLREDLPYETRLTRPRCAARRVSPSADIMDVTVRNNEPTSAWFDIDTFDDLYQGEDVEDFVHSQQQLNKLVNDERERMVRDGKEPRIALMGFSQGAVMTILAVLTASSADRYEAGIALSGYLPLVSQADTVASPAAKDIPLLWLHGRNDPYLTIAKAEDGVRQLRREPIGLRNLVFKSYDWLEHFWDEAELDDMARWFAKTVPRHRPRKPTFNPRPNVPTLPGSSSAAFSADTPTSGKEIVEVEALDSEMDGAEEEEEEAQDAKPHDSEDGEPESEVTAVEWVKVEQTGGELPAKRQRRPTVENRRRARRVAWPSS
ncbi:hypothetical protein JCM1840_003209 [Sporobolomyces johnsonii]